MSDEEKTEVPDDYVVNLSEVAAKSAIENMAQMTRFVFRGEITAEAAAELSVTNAMALATEMMNRATGD